MPVEACSAPEPRRRLSPYAAAPRLPEGSGLSPQAVFAEPPTAIGGIELEIGPGRGGFLLERVAHRPDVALIGLEIRLKWASLVDDKARQLGLSARARVFAEDIRLALPRFADAGFRRAFVNFPDPWWKKRHAKRRLASDGVIGELARVLAPGGELFVQTDVAETAAAYRVAIEGSGAFAAFGDEPGSALLAENPYGARSPRERRVMADGLPITRLRFRRVGGEAG
jgi:tRNA (guanine-N7-)-methyltransferase